MMHKAPRLRYLFCLLLAAACSSKSNAQAPSNAPPGGLPPSGADDNHTMGVHDQAAAPELPAGHPQLPPGHPSVAGGGGMDMQQPNFDPSQLKVDPSKVLSGAIAVSPKVKDKVKAGDVLFISVRQEQQGLPGPILAVDKMEAKDGPMTFMIDGHKAMVPGTEFKGKVIITVRDDKDGDAMTKNPGDVEGKAVVEIPSKHVVITLDTVLP